MEDNRFCRRCLLSDMPESAVYNSIKSYIEGIDKELKADNDEYEKRLSTCRSCGKLINGMCRVCGCFVEMRAVVAVNYCPDTNRKW